MTKETPNADASIPVATSRRNFIVGVAAGVVGAGLIPFSEPGVVLAGVPGQVSTATRLVAVSLKDFGAKGDGVTNDTQAVLKLIAHVSARGGGVRIVIPPGIYIVGGQTAGAGGQRYLGTEFVFNNCAKPIIIEGDRAILKHPQGLRWGSFNADGAIHNPRSMPFYDPSYAASTGTMLHFRKCANVAVKGLELDGNNTTYIIGGNWGDKEIQARSYGLVFENCKSALAENVYAHNFGLDGLYVQAFGTTEATEDTPVTLINCRFEYNGRQGLSWTGGNGLVAKNCKFNHTGYAINTRTGRPVFSAPGAGVDMEPEPSDLGRGKFINCEFLHNRGVSVLAVQTTHGGIVRRPYDVTLENCLIWNFANFSIWGMGTRLVFRDCKIYGAPVNPYTSAAKPSDAVKFYNCEFEDKSHPVYGNTFQSAGYMIHFDPLAEGLKLINCKFTANLGRIIIRGSVPNGRAFEMDGCTVIIKAGGQYYLQSGFIRRTRIINLVKGAPAPYVETNGLTTFGDGVYLDAPGVPGLGAGLLSKTR